MAYTSRFTVFVIEYLYMNKKVVKISEEATVKNLVQFFSGSRESNEVTPREIFIAVGRAEKDPAKNMAWLSNKLSTMRHYSLFERVYDEGNKSKFGGAKLLKIVLTEKGRVALNRTQQETPHGLPANPLARGEDEVSLETLEVINQLISRVRQKMPNWEFELIDGRVVLRSKARN